VTLFRRALLGFAVSLPVALAACGPDGRSVGDSCPDLPLYRYVFDTSTKTWTRIHLDPGDAGEPLTDAEVSAIAKAEQQGCITGGGNADTLSATPGDGSTSGTGGGLADAGSD